MPPATRSVPLSEAMRTFGESVQDLDNRERSMALYRVELLEYAGRLAPIAFARLYREIEHENSFSSDADAAQERIKQVVRKVIREISPSFGANKDLAAYMTDLVTWKTCQYVDKMKAQAAPAVRADDIRWL